MTVNLKEFNDDVLYVTDKVVRLGSDELVLLKDRAKTNKRHRARICTHPNTEDSLHEMFIAIKQGTYIRPHKHLGKSESFHVIEGSVDVIIFDDNGTITEVNRVSDDASDGVFYHRISEPVYHTLLIRSDFLVFHEITNGPFKQEHTQYALWAPDETDTGVKQYMEALAQNVSTWTETTKTND